MALGSKDRTSADRASFWRGHIAAQGASGLSVRGYCREHGLGEGLFYQWRRRLRRDDGSHDRGAIVPPSLAFAEVRLAPLGASCAPAEAGSGVEVVLAGERRLRLAQDFDVETLRRAVAALESLPC